jgi:hypothetical protein
MQLCILFFLLGWAARAVDAAIGCHKQNLPHLLCPFPRCRDVVRETHIASVVFSEEPMLKGFADKAIVINYCFHTAAFKPRVQRAGHPVPREVREPAKSASEQVYQH